MRRAIRNDRMASVSHTARLVLLGAAGIVYHSTRAVSGAVIWLARR